MPGCQGSFSQAKNFATVRASENGDKFFFLVAARFQISVGENRQFFCTKFQSVFFFPQFCDLATMEIIHKEI
jgi:hypothetical protein